MALSVRAAFLRLGFLACTLLPASRADADTAVPLVVFQTVDSYGVVRIPSSGAYAIEVVGLIAGETAAAGRVLKSDNESVQSSCERAAIQVLNRPGRLRLEVFGSLSNEIVYGAKCRVVRTP